MAAADAPTAAAAIDENVGEVWHAALFTPCRPEEVGTISMCEAFGFCWVTFVLQLLVGAALLIFVTFHPERWRWEIVAKKSSSPDSSPDLNKYRRLDANGEPRPQQKRPSLNRAFSSDVRTADVLTPLERSMSPDFATFLTALRTEPSFCKQARDEVNFMRSNTDPMLFRPPDYPTERWTNDLSRSNLYRYLFLFQLRDTFLRSLAFAFLASSIGTLLWMLIERERFDAQTERGDASFFWSSSASSSLFSSSSSRSGAPRISLPITTFLASARSTVTEAQANFKFYPIFLIQGYAAYAIVRWRSFVTTSYAIQGRIHDVALVVGGAIARPSELRSRQMAFRLYRYLNLVHLLCYMSKHEWLKKLTLETNFVQLGLLTPIECAVLEPMKNKKRDTVLAWISCEIQQGIASGLLYPSCTTTALDNVAFLRGKMAAFHDQFSTNQPALWAALMIFMVDVLVVLILLGAPLQFYLESSMCLQWWIALGVLLLTLPFTCTSEIIQMLQNPYTGEHGDVFNVDALMASTEQCIFASLRARFDQVGNFGTEPPTTAAVATTATASSSLPSFSFSDGHAAPSPAPGPTTKLTPRSATGLLPRRANLRPPVAQAQQAGTGQQEQQQTPPPRPEGELERNLMSMIRDLSPASAQRRWQSLKKTSVSRVFVWRDGELVSADDVKDEDDEAEGDEGAAAPNAPGPADV